ncbi:hypothetical protein ACH5RR_021274 [Cinchona calisaya]|uniref:Uncharacterized protein n=1 Tax=Cinchona calisaya TaxID=153742 RepID=A0ABD2ZKB5_9GENT
MKELKKISDQVFKDLEISPTEIKSHKSNTKKLRTERDLLKVERADLEDTVDLARSEFANVSMQWKKNELFDPSMSKELVEALGDLFRTVRMEQNLTQTVLPSRSNQAFNLFSKNMGFGIGYLLPAKIIFLDARVWLIRDYLKKRDQLP